MFFKYAVEKYYYTKNIGDKLLAYDLNQAVIYDLLERKHRLEFYQAEQIIFYKTLSNDDSQVINALYLE